MLTKLIERDLNSVGVKLCFLFERQKGCITFSFLDIL